MPEISEAHYFRFPAADQAVSIRCLDTASDGTENALWRLKKIIAFTEFNFSNAGSK